MSTYHVFKNSVVVSVEGKAFVIHQDDPRYKKVLEAVVSNELDKLSGLIDAESVDEIRNLLKLK